MNKIKLALILLLENCFTVFHFPKRSTPSRGLLLEEVYSQSKRLAEWQSKPAVSTKVYKEKDTWGEQIPIQTKSYRSNEVILTEKFVNVLIEVTELKKHNEIKIKKLVLQCNTFHSRYSHDNQ